MLSSCLEGISLRYLKRIYDQYASVCKGNCEVFDTAGARRYTAAFSRYFRDWLPAQRDVKILDLACGSGRTLFLLKEMGYSSITGVDISAEQVTLARQVTSNVSQGDVLGFLDGSNAAYGLIIAQDIVEHLTKDELFDLLDACFAALAPGGRLILSSPNAESPMFAYRRYGDPTHEICFTPPALAHVLTIVGFGQISSREIGPHCHGGVSCARSILWWMLRRLVMFWNLVEIGNAGSGVYTRDFLISAVKPRKAKEA